MTIETPTITAEEAFQHFATLQTALLLIAGLRLTGRCDVATNVALLLIAAGVLDEVPHHPSTAADALPVKPTRCTATRPPGSARAGERCVLDAGHDKPPGVVGQISLHETAPLYEPGSTDVVLLWEDA